MDDYRQKTELYNYEKYFKIDHNLPWVEKYRPKDIKSFQQSDGVIKMYEHILEEGIMQNLILYGPPGTGKTSSILALGMQLFEEKFDDRVIKFNASDECGIKVVREKIAKYAKQYRHNGVTASGKKYPPFKIIIMDEADQMTEDAQDALRLIIEEYSSVTRFCFIVNYLDKISHAIRSRCVSIYFEGLHVDTMIKGLTHILNEEKMNIKNLNLIHQLSKGDMRSAIMITQNIKYLTDFKKLFIKEKPKNDTEKNLLTYKKFLDKDIPLEITDEEIIEASNQLPPSRLKEILDRCKKLESIKAITKFVKQIMNEGYPIDGIIEGISQIVEDEPYANEMTIMTTQILANIRKNGDLYINFSLYLSNYWMLVNNHI